MFEILSSEIWHALEERLVAINLSECGIKEQVSNKVELRNDHNIPYIGNFSRREIFTKIPREMCVIFSLESYFRYFKGSQWRRIVGFIFLCVCFWRFQGGRELSEN